MSRMLSTEDIIILIEEKTNNKVYNICGVGKGVDIEGTDFQEHMIWVYEKQNLIPLRVLTADVVNIIDVEFTGYPQATEAHHHRI